jgi:hypothetical protein
LKNIKCIQALNHPTLSRRKKIKILPGLKGNNEDNFPPKTQY